MAQTTMVLRTWCHPYLHLARPTSSNKMEVLQDLSPMNKFVFNEDVGSAMLI